MTTAGITAAEALRLAREALEDDKRMTPGPFRLDVDGDIISDGTPDDNVVGYLYNDADRDGYIASRTREPQLARFVEAVLAALDRVDHANYRDRSGMAAETAKYFEGWTDAVDEIWRLARAADAAEAKR